MAVRLRRPILVGGLGLTASLWLLDSFGDSIVHVGGELLLGAIVLGSGYLWLQQFLKPTEAKKSLLPSIISRTTAEQSLADVESLIDELAVEAAQSTALPDRGRFEIAMTAFRSQIAQLHRELDRSQLRLAVLGNQGVGKTALVEWLTANWLPAIAKQADSPLDAVTLQDASSDAAVQTAADVVLFLTAGDLTDSEFQQLQALVNKRQRVVLVFNKQDQYLPDQRPVVLQQVRQRVKDLLAANDVVAIAAVPAAVKVRQHQPDGSVQERLEQPAPEISALSDRLQAVLQQEGAQLVWTTVSRQALDVRQAVLADVNQIRRDRATPLIEQAQWIAAAAAFANPVPTLDLLATAAVNTQLVLDLGEIYHQKFSVDQAKEVAGTLASQMVKLGLVELSTQAIAPLLKGSTLTYVAGGLLQGLSAAYLTRIAGLSLVEYLQEQSQNPSFNPESSLQLDRLMQTLQRVFQANQRTAFVQNLVKQGIRRLTPAPAQPIA